MFSCFFKNQFYIVLISHLRTLFRNSGNNMITFILADNHLTKKTDQMHISIQKNAISTIKCIHGLGVRLKEAIFGMQNTRSSSVHTSVSPLF